MLLTEILPRAAAACPDKLAVICGAVRLPYSEVARRVSCLSSALAAFGVERGERVALLHRNCHRVLGSYFAAAHGGAVLVPLNYRLTARDLAYIIVDRKKDVILTGTEMVYSTEVENAPYEHPFVLEAAVVGIPDERWGEAVKAVVVLKPGCCATAAEIIAHCQQRIARYKCPRSVEFIDALPRTGSGKISKKELRKRY